MFDDAEWGLVLCIPQGIAVSDKRLNRGNSRRTAFVRRMINEDRGKGRLGLGNLNITH